jgi:hypothetical protein
MFIYPHSIDKRFGIGVDRSYLDNFFPNQTCFILSDQTLNENYSINELRQHLTWAGKVDQILIDLSHNPYRLRHHQKHINTLIQEGSQWATTQVLTGDYSYYYHVPEHYAFFPAYVWGWSLKHKMWYHQMMFDVPNIEKTQTLCCLNHRPSWYRIYLFNHLANTDFFNSIDYTFGNHDSRYINYTDEAHLLTADELDAFDKNKHLLPRWVTDEDRDLVSDITRLVGTNHSSLTTCAVNLCSESGVDETNFLTEKSCKPFMCYQIPVFIGSLGLSQFWQDLGLDMFEDIVPWKTWDQLDDPRQRITATVDFLKEFMLTDVLALHKSLSLRLQQNKDYFHSESFRKRLIKL